MPTDDVPAVLVTGAARGLGRAMAQHLADVGWRVAATDRDLDGLNASGLRGVTFAHCDIGDPDSVDVAVEEVRQRFGRLDGVVNNGAIVGVTRAPAAEITLEEFDLVMRVNLRGPWLVYRAALPHLTGGGAVVNVSSETAFAGSINMSHYVASKAGLVGLTRALAREAAPHGVRVNAIAPGYSDTPGARAIGSPESYEVAATPLGRVGQPEDMVGAVAFLLSPASSFVTGQTLLINGGRTFA